jgi:hypothetical protein
VLRMLQTWTASCKQTASASLHVGVLVVAHAANFALGCSGGRGREVGFQSRTSRGCQAPGRNVSEETLLTRRHALRSNRLRACMLDGASLASSTMACGTRLVCMGGRPRVFFECACAFLSNTWLFSFMLSLVLRGSSRAFESTAEGRRVQGGVQNPEAR